MSEKRCYTVQELQEILGVRRLTIYNLLKKKEFRWIQLDGGTYRMSYEDAVVKMVDTNLHREHISFSEKAFAYRMKNEAMNYRLLRAYENKCRANRTLSRNRERNPKTGTDNHDIGKSTPQGDLPCGLTYIRV